MYEEKEKEEKEKEYEAWITQNPISSFYRDLINDVSPDQHLPEVAGIPIHAHSL